MCIKQSNYKVAYKKTIQTQQEDVLHIFFSFYVSFNRNKNHIPQNKLKQIIKKTYHVKSSPFIIIPLLQ